MALSLSGAPVWRSPWNQRAWGLVGVPIEVSFKLSSSWEALAGEEEPGGREEQRTNAMVVGGEERSLQEAGNPEECPF